MTRKVFATILGISLFAIASSSLARDSFRLDVDELEQLDGASISLDANTHGELVLEAIKPNGSGVFTAEFWIQNRPYHCKFVVLRAGRVIAAQSNECGFVDNGQAYPTECNYFLEARRGRRNFTGNAYCSHAPYIYNVRIRR